MFPLALTLTLGWGKVEVPPDSLAPAVTWVFPREFKKIKKINAFLSTAFKLRFITQVMNPNVLQAGTCARPYGCGASHHFFHLHGSGMKGKSSSQSSREESMSENRTDNTMSSTMS